MISINKQYKKNNRINSKIHEHQRCEIFLKGQWHQLDLMWEGGKARPAGLESIPPLEFFYNWIPKSWLRGDRIEMYKTMHHHYDESTSINNPPMHWEDTHTKFSNTGRVLSWENTLLDAKPQRTRIHYPKMWSKPHQSRPSKGGWTSTGGMWSLESSQNEQKN